MIPSSEVVWLRLDDDMTDHVRRIGEVGLGRYPVLEAAADPDRAGRDDVAGILYMPSLFKGTWPPPDDLDLRPHLAHALYLSSDLPVAALIDRLQEAHQEMAIPTDPGDRDPVVGIVTASDGSEVIAGELEDPLDMQHSEASRTRAPGATHE